MIRKLIFYSSKMLSPPAVLDSQIDTGLQHDLSKYPSHRPAPSDEDLEDTLAYNNSPTPVNQEHRGLFGDENNINEESQAGESQLVDVEVDTQATDGYDESEESTLPDVLNDLDNTVSSATQSRVFVKPASPTAKPWKFPPAAPRKGNFIHVPPPKIANAPSPDRVEIDTVHRMTNDRDSTSDQSGRLSLHHLSFK
jgi:hypothetical protein